MNWHTLKVLAGPVIVLALLTGVALATRPLTPIDETRYVGVAWEMWLKSAYLVPIENGEPYSHKPPLLFWLFHAGWALFGVNDWWPRLVSPLFSLGGLLLTVSIARRLWPTVPEVQRSAPWILGTSLWWMAFSTFAMFDVMLAFFVLLGMRGLLIAADESLPRGFAWLAAAIGFGALAKGPVVLLHLLPAALLATWWQGETTEIARQRWYGGLALALLGGAAIALAWAIPAALHGGKEYRAAILWGQTLNRMVNSFAHKQPFWWYLPGLFLLLFPWLVWPGLWRRLMAVRREGLDRGLRFCLAWMLPVFVAFSFVSGKQLHYLVPLIPAFALLAARALATGETGGGLWLPALLTALVGAAMLYASLAGLPAQFALESDLPAWPGLVLLLAAPLAARAGRTRKRRVPVLALLAASLFALVHIYAAPVAHAVFDVRPIAQAIKALQDKGVPVANLGKYHGQFQFSGRLEQPLTPLDSSELPAWLERHPQGVVVAYLRRTQEAPEVLFGQPYRGGQLVLLNAEQARRLPELSAPEPQPAQ